MTDFSIPYNQTGYFSSMILDYLNEEKKLSLFYELPFTIEAFKKKIESRNSFLLNRELLVKSIHEQYQYIEPTSEVISNILLLKESNTYTVTTGHQLNLFTGPLYFIYKIISTINLSKSLKEKYPELNFVPIYWMATEDHDYEEINHFNIFKKRIELPKTQSGTVGRMKLQEIEGVFQQLQDALGSRPQADEILDLFKTHYLKEKTFADATRAIVNFIFGKEGLVIIDGDDKSLKKLFIGEFKNDLITQNNENWINQTSQKLNNMGYHLQIKPRNINLFYLQENSRERIVFENSKYKVLNTEISFSESEIIDELENFPERFSPNVALRPLYQEKILPNVAYIGGGGELAYWLQLKEMFDKNKISYPILVLRNSAMLVDESTLLKLNKIDFKIEQLFGNIDDEVKKTIINDSEINLDLTNEIKQIEELYDKLKIKAEKIDLTLKPMVDSELQKVKKSIQHIEEKLVKAEKLRNESKIAQIRNCKEKLFPSNELQERVENLSLLYIMLGSNWKNILLEKLNPLKKEFIIIKN